MRKLSAVTVLLFSIHYVLTAATYYVDYSTGDDNYNGLYSSYSSGTNGPWKTLEKINRTTLSPGDTVLFKRGEKWRGYLRPQSGTSGNQITFSCYGDQHDSKPLLLGSSECNNSGDWVNEGSNIWSTAKLIDIAVADGSELLPNPSFDSSTTGWSFYCSASASASGSRDTQVYYSAPASYKIVCSSAGSSGGDIQLSVNSGLTIKAESYYLLSFRAKCTQAASLSLAVYQSGGISDYCSWFDGKTQSISTDWTEYKMLCRAAYSASDARITFFLGTGLPSGATLYMDSLSFKECSNLVERLPLKFDVGNIIFNNGESCGAKVWSEAELSEDHDANSPIYLPEAKQGRYWYDEASQQVKIYSTSNPATYYDDIELALEQTIINYANRSHLVFDNLALSYGSAHGFGGVSAACIDIYDCDISFIGGALLEVRWGTTPIRYGNGVEFMNSAHDCVVEGCKIWEIYDAAMTNQGDIGSTQYNIYYRNNIVWNSEFSYEIWVWEDSNVDDIYVENNTFAYAGYGWGHYQRTDSHNGRHLMLRSVYAATSDFHVRNNIVFEATESCVLINNWPFSALTLDNNLYYTSSGLLASWTGEEYTLAEFADYQNDTGKETNSSAGDPGFVNQSGCDFHLASNSVAIDDGAATGITRDFNYQARPVGPSLDIGAYEYDYNPVTTGLVAHWKLDETSAGIAADSYGRNHADAYGVTVNQPGQCGQAYSFDGTNDSVAVPTQNFEEISVAAWFCKTAKDTTYADSVFGAWRYNGDVQLQEGFDFRFYQGSPDVLEFTLVSQTSGGTRTRKSCTYNLGTDHLNKWYHFVGTYNKTTGVQSLYVNGQLASTNTHTAGNTIVPLTTYTDMRIGYSRANTGWFTGKIDDVRIYNRPLNSTEAANLYSQTSNLILDDYTLSSYGGTAQDITNTQYEFLDSGKTLHLWGNNWKAIEYSVTVSAATVMEFDFKCTAEGEVHSIGLDTQTASVSTASNCQLHGSQTWGIQTYNGNYSGSDWKHYIVPIGRHVSAGTYNYITFSNDDDASSSGNIYIRNLRVYTP